LSRNTFRHFVIRSAKIHRASSHKGEYADRSTAEIGLFTDSGHKIIVPLANPASTPKSRISESHPKALKDH